MALDFKKVDTGTTLNFTKDFGEIVSGKVTFNLNWGKINGRSVDLDAFLVMEARDRTPKQPQVVPVEPSTVDRLKSMFGMKLTKTIDLVASSDFNTKTVYYGNLQERGVVHHGDDLTGAWAKGEYIEVDLDKLNPNIDTLTFSVLSFSGHRFCDLPFASIQVFRGTPKQQILGLIEHELTQFKPDTKTVVMAQLKRNTQFEWELTALKQESSSKSSNGVTALSMGV